MWDLADGREKGHMKPQIQQFFENNPAVVA